MEVAVVAVGIEVGYSAGKLYRGEDAAALLGADLFAGSREGLDGRGSIGRNRGRAAAAYTGDTDVSRSVSTLERCPVGLFHALPSCDGRTW